jgi:hypothetical protein
MSVINFVVPKGQKERVLEYLYLYGRITPLDAMREYGIMRLAAVIFELRDKKGGHGIPIETRMREDTNRFGEKVRYAEYVLKDGDSNGEG